MAMFRSFIDLTVIAHVSAYVWIEDNKHLEAVVGISLYDEPLCTGVLIKDSSVLTAAYPLQDIWEEHGKHIRVAQVIYSYDQNITYHAYRVASNESNRAGVWVTVGPKDAKHSTVHDLMIIRLHETLFNVTRNNAIWHTRRKFFSPIATIKSYFSSEDVWYFAGFGFVDDEHLKNSDVLEVEYLGFRTQADCDEWVPREWGRFLCFYDFNNLTGVPSGAPLYHGPNFIPGLSAVYGIGSFSLTKGTETILVFTDLRAYTHKLHSWM